MATPRLDGIDTSRWQDINESVPLPALTFAMHKATEGRSAVDRELAQFTKLYRSSRQVRHVGFYHWLRPDSSAREQAQHFIDTIRANGGLLPGEFAVCDWERTVMDGKPLPFPSIAEVETWCALVGAAFGKNRVAVYSAPWVTGFSTWRARNPDVALFLANYRTNPLRPGNGWAESKRWNATAWQWTSTGKTPGIIGDCDQNHVFIPAWFDALSPKPPIVVTVPKPTLRWRLPNMSGAEVILLQRQMKFWGWYTASVDGRFGTVTRDAVKKMQKALRVPVDGIYGPITAAAFKHFAQSLAAVAAAKGK